MQYISHFTHAFLMFVAPLSFLGYKSTIKQKVLFTLLYGLGVTFSRGIYDFFPLPFGIHTPLLIILSVILFKNILKDFSFQNSIFVSLIMFTVLLINDSLIVLPLMKLFHLTINSMGDRNFLVFLISIVLSDFTLILTYIVGYFKNKNNKGALLNN